jgi:hypothetical protein
MTVPVVTEKPLRLEPVVHDPFIDDVVTTTPLPQPKNESPYRPCH